MIHAVRIKDGKASYANRYVHTKKLETERRFGHSMYLKVGCRGTWCTEHSEHPRSHDRHPRYPSAPSTSPAAMQQLVLPAPHAVVLQRAQSCVSAGTVVMAWSTLGTWQHNTSTQGAFCQTCAGGRAAAPSAPCGCPQFGDMHGFGGLWHAGLAELRRKVGVTPRGDGEGTANTALVFHAKQLLALHEGDLPYAVRRIHLTHPVRPCPSRAPALLRGLTLAHRPCVTWCSVCCIPSSAAPPGS